jgi:isopropylmalate/homocitrate/citramalate synthase
MGWNTLKARAETLGLSLSDDTLKAITQEVKRRADTRALTVEEIDALLHDAATVGA